MPQKYHSLGDVEAGSSGDYLLNYFGMKRMKPARLVSNWIDRRLGTN